VVIAVLDKFRKLIDQLEVLHQKRDRVNRSDWQDFKRLGFHAFNQTDPQKAIGQIVKRGFGEDPYFSFTSEFELPAAFLDEFESIHVVLQEIENEDLRELAYTGALLLLYKLHQLPRKKRLELRTGEYLKNFIEQDADIAILAHWLGRDVNGSLSFLTSRIIEHFAIAQAVETAA